MSARNFYTDHRIASSLEERSFDHHYLDIKNVNCFPSDKVLKIKFPSLGSFSYFATKRFLRKVDKIKPDIIHLHNIHGNYINYKLLFECT